MRKNIDHMAPWWVVIATTLTVGCVAPPRQEVSESKVEIQITIYSQDAGTRQEKIQEAKSQIESRLREQGISENIIRDITTKLQANTNDTIIIKHTHIERSQKKSNNHMEENELQ